MDMFSYDHISLLATDNSTSPAEVDYLDSRLEFSLSENLSPACRRVKIQACEAWHKAILIDEK